MMQNKFGNNKINQQADRPYYMDKLWWRRAGFLVTILLTIVATLFIHISIPSSIHKKMAHLKASCEEVLPRNQDCVLDMQYVPKKGK